ncbi:MAG: transposase [Paludibacter sp.]
MPYNPNKHHRRSIRLKGYDYSKAGLYFITICCQDRACMFGEIVGTHVGAHPCGRPNNDCTENNNPKMQLNDAGKMVDDEWLKLPKRFENIQLHEYIVMPNHFHGILEIIDVDTVGAPLVGAQNNDDTSVGSSGRPQIDDINGRPQGHAPTAGKTVGDMMDAFKSITTVEYINGVKTMNWQRFNGKLWQRDYYEHIIRNEQSYETISNYIINNPAKWKEDKFYI